MVDIFLESIEGPACNTTLPRGSAIRASMGNSARSCGSILAGGSSIAGTVGFGGSRARSLDTCSKGSYLVDATCNCIWCIGFCGRRVFGIIDVDPANRADGTTQPSCVQGIKQEPTPCDLCPAPDQVGSAHCPHGHCNSSFRSVAHQSLQHT